MYKKKERITKQMAFMKNNEIEDSTFILVDENNVSLGVKSKKDALELAAKKGLDVVLVSKNDKHTVCKLIDYDHFRYEMSKKEKAAKKKQVKIETKEVQLSATIDKHDFNTKVNQAKKFISKGERVRVVLRLRGREMALAGTYVHLISDFVTELKDVAKVVVPVKEEGRFISVILQKK